MIDSIKIGIHNVAIVDHADEYNHCCSFTPARPAITLMRCRGAFDDVKPVFMASQLLSRVLCAIECYSNIDNKNFDNNACYLVGNILLGVLKDNENLFCVEGFSPPCKIKIGAFDFYVDTITEDKSGNNSAVLDFNRGKIFVYPNKDNQEIIDKNAKLVSLWHEIFHAICLVCQLESLNNDEIFIDSMAEWWVMVLQDNPEFVQYLKEVLVSV